MKMTIDVAGETVEYVMAGSGSPAIVLVNGAGGPVDAWFKIFTALAGEHCTFAYNRPGIGASSKPVRAQTADEMVEALRDVLDAAGVPRPYVLVGHSFGGLVVNLFARLYPEEVGAVVLLEATSPDDLRVLPRHESMLQRGLKALGERLMPAHPLAETRHVDQDPGRVGSGAAVSADSPVRRHRRKPSAALGHAGRAARGAGAAPESPGEVVSAGQAGDGKGERAFSAVLRAGAGAVGDQRGGEDGVAR